MNSDKKMIEKALILEGKLKGVEWVSDLGTVLEMRGLGVRWRTIQAVLAEKYGKIYSINELASAYGRYLRAIQAKPTAMGRGYGESVPRQDVGKRE